MINTKFKQTEIGEIPEKWEILSVNDLIIKNILEKPLDGNHGGLHPKHNDFVDHGVPFITAADLVNGEVNVTSCHFISEKQASTLKKGFSKTDDVLISHKATIGRTAIVKETPTDYIILTPQVTYYRVRDKNKLDKQYLKYYFDSQTFQEIFNKWAGGGSTRSYLGITEQLKLPIVLPPIEEQKQIASILSSLDDKIELNQKTIKTLEEIGQTLFKRWFIDFEFPNEKGEPYKSSGGEIINSELGEIPKGWSIGTVKDIATIKSGFAFKGDDLKKQGDFGIVKIKNVNDGVVNIQDTEYISESTSKKATNFKLSFGDVLIAMSGNTTGKIGIMPKTDLTFYLNQRVGKYFIKDKKEVLKGFLYFYITRPDIKQNTIEKAYGSAQPNISPSILESCEIVIPPTNEFETIFNFFNQIIFEISEKTYEIVKTSNLRDSLLPKLLSGKIRIN